MSTKRKKGPEQPIPLQLIAKVDAAKEEAIKLDGTQANAEHIAPHTEPQDLIFINHIDDFVMTMQAWHTAKIEMLRKLGQIPGDGGLTFQFEGQDMLMQGDVHKGFLMGIHTAIGMFAELPFEEVKDEPAAASNDEPAAS